MSVTIWHNPRCSKSRQTLELLREQGISPTIKTYLTDPPSKTELETVLGALGYAPSQLIRKGDKAFKELGLDISMPETELLNAMVEHPALIERPVVIVNGKAAIGRPPEAVLDLF